MASADAHKARRLLLATDRHCAPSPAHESLRRFAQTHGARATFGTIASLGGAQRAQSDNNVDADSEQPVEDRRVFVFGKEEQGKDCEKSNRDDVSTFGNLLPVITLEESQGKGSVRDTNKPIVEHGNVPEKDCLVFGANAPKCCKVSIATRRSVPKRMRETTSVDALSGLFADMKGVADGSSTGDESGKGVHSEDVLAAKLETLEVKKRRRKARVYIKGNGSDDEKKCTKEYWKKDAEKSACKNDTVKPLLKGTADTEKQPSASNNTPSDEEDFANELSFLVTRCDIDADDKQAAFMPYIV